jgi:hypothetical protein
MKVESKGPGDGARVERVGVGDMSIQIELKPEVEAELKSRAQKDGLALSQYVQRILEQYLPAKPVESTVTPAERAKAFQNWVENFPYRRTSPLSDDAISREGIYRTD